jgi:RNA polymerase sigma-70 factor (sigma-E family)
VVSLRVVDDSVVEVSTSGTAGSEPVDGWFDDVYRQHWAGMVRLAFAMVDDRAVAEDLAQEAFARVFRARDRVRDPLPYLRSALYNGCRNHLRDLGRRRRRDARSLLGDGGGASGGAAPVGDHVMDVVRRLPFRQRSLVVLRYYEGLTDTEIAVATGMPVGTVKSTLHRTLAALREELS